VAVRSISFWQPWASAISVGAKKIETRGWYTGYRGPLAIHSAKRMIKREILELHLDKRWLAALAPLLDPQGIHWMLPFGAIVAICDLSDCCRTELFPSERLDEPRGGWTERDMGDFYPGRWGWVLEHVTPLTVPLEWKGSQGFFDVPDEHLEGRFNA
jgi:activating signal cointegrator 1